MQENLHLCADHLRTNATKVSVACCPSKPVISLKLLAQERIMLDSSNPRISESDHEFLARLNSLDFGPLVYKLMHAEDRPGLSLDQAIDAVKKYKGFLFLYHANQGASISPSRYVDYVWHTHIVDTELYSVQTAFLFGHYMHHFPFFGKRSADDQRTLLDAAHRTMKAASSYFNWDEDDWCGTKVPKHPFPPRGHVDLVDVIFPAGASIAEGEVNPDVFSFHAGNFRCTVEHFGGRPPAPYLLHKSSRLEALERLLRLPPWVVICKPVDVLNDIFQVVDIARLPDIAKTLVDQRLSPEAFAAQQVRLELAAQH